MIGLHLISRQTNTTPSAKGVSELLPRKRKRSMLWGLLPCIDGAVPDQMRRPVIIRIYIPAIALFCKTRTTTRRFSACPSAVASLPTWRLSPIAAGAIILVRGM
jgi:hypothetical protein